MKTRPPPDGKIYRNDTVYRSAQKLLSLPTRTPAKRHGLRQFLIVTATLTLGILIGFYARSSSSATAETPAAETHSPQSSVSNSSPIRTAVQTSTLASASVPPSSTTSQQAPESDSIDSRTSRKTSSTARRSNPTTSTPAATTLVHQTASVVSSSELYLYGELRSPSSPAETVMLRLRQADTGSPDPIFGVIRFLKENHPFAGNALAGGQNGPTLTLRETGPVWVNGDINIIPVGRRFVITIPLDITTAEFTGTWSLGDTHGTLHLKAATSR